MNLPCTSKFKNHPDFSLSVPMDMRAKDENFSETQALG